MLTHYTSGIEELIGILRNGFAWVANRRNLMPILIPDHDFSAREPQQFGMVSFTELGPSEAAAHTSVFGAFGVVVRDEWALAKQIRRVIYLDDSGPVTAAWQAVFAIGYNDLTARIRYPDDGAWLMSYHNKAMAAAVAGALLWANLLQIYEYMEAADFSGEHEWRAIQDSPNYSISSSVSEAVTSISPARNWAKHLNALTFSRSDVAALVCPSSQVAALRGALDGSYAGVPILESDG